MEYWEDETREATLDEVLESKADLFEPKEGYGAAFGLTPAAVWARLEVENLSGEPADLCLELPLPNAHHVEFYAPTRSGYTEMSADLSEPFYSRRVIHRQPAFPIFLAPGEQATYYVRAQSPSPVQFGAMLWTSEAFEESARFERTLAMIFYGFLLIIAIFNISVYVGLMSRSYLYYALFVLGFALYDLSYTGYGHEYLWPHWPAWASVSVVLFCCATLAAGTAFARAYLDTRYYAPWQDRLLLVLAIASGVTGGVYLYDPYLGEWLVHGVAAACCVAILMAGITGWRSGRNAARYFVVSWGVFLLGSLAVVLAHVGVLPTESIATHMSRAGFVLAVILLSLPLTGRVDAEERSRREALEREIQVRTRELWDAVSDLRKSEEKLRESEELHRSVVERASDGIAVVQDGTVRLANASMADMLGYSVDELQGHSFELLVHPRSRMTLRDLYARQASGDAQAAVSDIELIRRDGHHLQVEQSGRAIRFQGDVALLLMVRDVTERRQSEEALRQSESLYRQAIANAAGVPYQYDHGRARYDFIGAGFHSLLGVPEDTQPETALVGRVLESVAAGDGDYATLEAYRYAFLRGEVDRWRVDYRIRTDDGEHRWLSDSAVPIRDEETDEVRASLGILQDITERKEAEQALIDRSLQDALTGLPNRRAFEEHANSEWRRAMRTQRPVTIVVADIDHFKAYNDTYGHLEGDQCLVTVARVMASCFERAGEFVGRWGGEEFAAVLPELTLEEAKASAEAMRASVERCGLKRGGSGDGPLTVSIGLANVVPETGMSLESAFEAADRALFHSKESGRNRVTVAEVSMVAG
jgi:diguanylate cyclase (GGDEF)-like protein/PAS domain S-box-containing protein